MASFLDALTSTLKKGLVLPGLNLPLGLFNAPPKLTQQLTNVAKGVGNFISPEATRLITETKNPVKKLAGVGLLGPEAIRNLGLQLPAQTFASLGLTATGQEKAAIPKGKIQQFVLGKEPIQPFHKIIEAGQLIGERTSKSVFPNAPPEVSGVAGLLGALLFGGLELSNVDIGIGGLTKKGTKKVLKATTEKLLESDGKAIVEKVAKDLIEKIGETESRKIAGRLAAEKATESIGRKLADALEIVKTGAIKDAEAIAKTLPEKTVSENIAKAVSREALPTASLRERGFITSAKEILPEAQNISGSYTPRSTEILAQKAANLVRDDIAAAEKFALSSTTQESVATASELLKHYAVLAQNVKDEAAKNLLYDKAAEIANNVAAKLTEQGRVIQAASILGRLTPEGQIRFAAKEIQRYNTSIESSIWKNRLKKIPELTGEQTKYISEEMKKIQGLPEGEAKAIRFQELQGYINKIIPSPLLKKLSTVWKAGLLTGIKTTGLNIYANIAHAGTEVLKDVPGTAADILLSLFTGKRTLTSTVRGFPSGVKSGVEKGWKYLRTGYDARDIAAKLDFTPVHFNNKAIQGYVDTIFRLLGAEDQPFYYGALNRSLNNQAIVEAKNKGIKGAEKKAFIEKLVKNPTDEMSALAIMDAETAVFQNKTSLGQAASGIARSVPGSEFVIPFRKTPSSVAMQVINYSPIGAIKEVADQIAKGAFDQRKLSQAIGRSVTGVVPLYIGGQLFIHGLLSLDYPTTERERELWKAEGRKPNTIKIGKDWRSIQTFGPLGNVLLMGGQFQRALKETGTPSGAIIQATVATIKSFTEQTFLKGVNDVMGAIADPQRNAQYVAASFLSSAIPTILNDIARATDPKERKASTIMERIQSRIPLLRQKLQPQVTITGEELARVGNPLEVMIDPSRPSPANESPTIMELRRLMDSGYKISPTMLGDKNGYKGLTPEQNTKLWKLAGTITDQKLSALFAMDSYQNLPDEDKAKLVEKFTDRAKLNARVGAVLSLTSDLQGEELQKKLAELKTGGIMNKEVFKEYLKLR